MKRFILTKQSLTILSLFSITLLIVSYLYTKQYFTSSSQQYTVFLPPTNITFSNLNQETTLKSGEERYIEAEKIKVRINHIFSQTCSFEVTCSKADITLSVGYNTYGNYVVGKEFTLKREQEIKFDKYIFIVHDLINKDESSIRFSITKLEDIQKVIELEKPITLLPLERVIIKSTGDEIIFRGKNKNGMGTIFDVLYKNKGEEEFYLSDNNEKLKAKEYISRADLRYDYKINLVETNGEKVTISLSKLNRIDLEINKSFTLTSSDIAFLQIFPNDEEKKDLNIESPTFAKLKVAEVDASQCLDLTNCDLSKIKVSLYQSGLYDPEYSYSNFSINFNTPNSRDLLRGRFEEHIIELQNIEFETNNINSYRLTFILK